MECLCCDSRLLWWMMFSANKGLDLDLDLEDKTTLLKYPQGMYMRKRRGGAREKLINSVIMSSHGLIGQALDIFLLWCSQLFTTTMSLFHLGATGVK